MRCNKSGYQCYNDTRLAGQTSADFTPSAKGAATGLAYGALLIGCSGPLWTGGVGIAKE